MASSKIKVQNVYPLTPMQEGMLFHALLEPDSAAYFEQLSWSVRGELDVAAFEASWNTLIERHAVLRTMFVHEGTDRPVQVVLESRPISVLELDLRGPGCDERAEEYRLADRDRPYVLARDPLLRVMVLRVAADRFEIVWSHHHIILDGWSIGLLIAELLEIYIALRANVIPKLATTPSFATFVKWLQAQDRDDALDYWARRLQDCEEPTGINHTRRTDAVLGGARETIHFELGVATTEGLKALASGRESTLAMILQAIWALLLSRYTDRGDVVFGSVVSGRPPEIPGVEGIVGNFINTIPIRVRLDEGGTFNELLARMQLDAAYANAFEHLALSEILAQTRLGDALFGTLVSFANYPVDPKLTGEAGWSGVGFGVDAARHVEQTHYDVDVQFIPTPELQVRISYARQFHCAAQMEEIEGHFVAVAEAILADPDTLLDDIDLLSVDEHLALTSGIGSDEPPNSADTLTTAFEQQAARTPSVMAVEAEDARLTYAELDRRANQLALAIASATRIETDTTIAVFVERTTDLPVALLAVLKSGAAYVPIDPSLPLERAKQIISDANCSAIVASHSTAADCKAISLVPIVEVGGYSTMSTLFESARVHPTDLAYIIYTSGSTGQPKGAMIEHRSVLNLVHGLNLKVYRGHKEVALRIALLASYAFDASVQQIFPALLLGHTLVIVDEETKQDGARLNRFLAKREIDLFDATPTLLRVMVHSDGFAAVQRNVLHALVGGEPLSWDLTAKATSAGGMRISNLYGPTECCVDASIQFALTDPACAASTVPVGHSMPNVHLFVVGRTGHLAPMGAPGEICIAGIGVGRGYINDPQLTARRFVRLASLGGIRHYRTSDYGRRLANGTIELLGRTDGQIKVRGYRIELGDVEHHLVTHPCVEQAGAYVASSSTGDELRAALVTNARVDADELRIHLGRSLPEYMIPIRIVVVDQLPRTSAGKLDRKHLAVAEPGTRLELGTAHAPPQNDVERQLVEIWQAVLEVPSVGIDDNYFSLGGDSIKAIQILSRTLRQGLHIEMQDLMHHRTIRHLAPLVTLSEPVAPAVSDAQSAGHLKLSAAQARFFTEHLVVPGKFHHAVLFEVRIAIDAKTLGAAFAAVRDRHEGLRTTFSPGPMVAPPGAPAPYVREVTDLSAVLPEMMAPFDLAAGELFRLAIIRSGESARLLIVVHHLCIDGVSWRVLAEELGILLSAAVTGTTPSLPHPSDGLTDIANHLASHAQSAAVHGELAYWQSIEARCGSLVEFPRHKPSLYRDRKTLTLVLDAAATSVVLTTANDAYGTSPEDLLLTALARAFHSEVEAMSTGILLESHGRYPMVSGADASRTIGWLTSLFPFVLSVDPQRQVGFQLKSVKEAIRAVPSHGIGYGLLRYLENAQLEARPQVSFNYLGQLDAGHSDAPLRFLPDVLYGNVSPDAETLAELEVSAYALAGQLRLTLAFSEQRFESVMASALLDVWRNQLMVIVEHCSDRTHIELTPADLSYSDITIDELEDIFK
ncbi:MAG: amino acid adenylation domain-containing protein [Chromatiales bacterium]|nr:amino acid adenylation domain-containing protein [Chromatiales bacterium]